MEFPTLINRASSFPFNGYWVFFVVVVVVVVAFIIIQIYIFS